MKQIGGGHIGFDKRRKIRVIDVMLCKKGREDPEAPPTKPRGLLRTRSLPNGHQEVCPAVQDPD